MRFRIQTKTKICGLLVICHSLSALDHLKISFFFFTSSWNALFKVYFKNVISFSDIESKL